MIAKTEEVKKGLMQQLLTKGIGHTEFKQTEIGEIPVEWEFKKIGDLFEFKNGLNKGKEYFGYGSKIVNYKDVYNNRSLKKEDINGLVEVNQSELNTFKVIKGDVLFTRTSETKEEIGLTAVIEDEIENLVFSGFLLRGRELNNLLDIGYKKYCFSSSNIRKQIINKSSCTTRALTNGTQLASILIPIPPIDEQVKIAAILNEIDNKIITEKDKVERLKPVKHGLMQQLLTGQVRVKID